MNYSTLDPLAAHSPEWQGQRSAKFPPTIRHLPRQDLIRTNFDMPDQTPRRGRGHFFEPSSFQKPEKPFRASLQRVPAIEHWHLRESSIRTMDFKPIEHPPRREMRHNIQLRHNPESSHPESLRTFYFANSKTEREYSVENRMQRKTRIDPVQLRRTFFQDITVFGK